MSKYYIIPKTEAEIYKVQVRYAWHWGLRAIEIENGDFVLREEVIREAERRFGAKITLDAGTVNEKEVKLDAEMKKYPVVSKENITFKTYDVEQELIKKK